MSNDLRDLNVASVCEMLGFQPDPDDSRQFKSDGFRISVYGQKWFDHVAGVGGGGAIDLVMHVSNISFVCATQYLSNGVANANHGELSRLHKKSSTKKPTHPPAPALNNATAIKKYLVEQRGLNSDLVQWCMDKGLIYADHRLNCCFRYGQDGVELRGTGAMQWRAVYGCLSKPFLLPAKNPAGIAVLESAIDALSYRQLHVDRVSVSIAGDGNHRLIDWVVGMAAKHKLPLMSAFDSDAGGDIANKILIESAYLAGVEVAQHRPEMKDWNDFLKHLNSTR